MTPETRAARDRIAAFLAAFAALPDARKDPGVPGRITAIADPENALACWELNAHDMQAVLAALDQQPDGFITCDHLLTEEAAEDLKRRFLAAQHDGAQVRVLNDQPRLAQAVEAIRDAARHGTDEPHEPVRDWARRTLDECGVSWYPDAPALDYRAVRREQHPADPEDGWKPGDIR